MGADNKPVATRKGGYASLRPGEKIIDNSNSGILWHYGGLDGDGSVTGEKGEMIFRRTMSTAAVHEGMVFVADLTGYLHCLDLKTGKRHWEHDLLSQIWGSPMVAGGRVLLGNADGVTIFEAASTNKVHRTVLFPSVIYSTPTIAGDVMYISDRSQLYAIDVANHR